MATLHNNEFGKKHKWVTVVNPINHRSLLQACDNCGVVKSENSIVRSCKVTNTVNLISSALSSDLLTG